MAVNWGLAGNAQRGFQNALAFGMQMGAQARQAQERKEYRNALAQFDPSKPETLQAVMAANPEVGLQLRGQVQAQQQEAQIAELTQQSLSDDPEISGPALDQLASVNFDRWSKLDTRQRAQAAEEAKVFGEAALDIASQPYDQRRGRIIGYAQQFPEYAEQINQIAFLPEAEQDAALRAAIVEAGLMERLQRMEQPQTFNVGPGEGRYERDPRTGEINTIVQPNYGQAPAFSPVRTNSQFTEGQTATNPQTGQRIVFRNGAWRPM